MNGSLIILDGIMFNNYGKMRNYKTIAIMDQETGIFKGIEVTEENCSLTSLDEIKRFFMHNQGNEKLVYGIYIGEELNYYVLNKKSCWTNKTVLSIDRHGSFFGDEASYDSNSFRLLSVVYKTSGNIKSIKNQELHDFILELLVHEKSKRFAQIEEAINREVNESSPKYLVKRI